MKNTWIFSTFWSIILGALFPILASQVVHEVPPFLTMGITYWIAFLIILVIIIFSWKLPELRNKKALKYAFFAAIIIGVINFGLYYYGIQFTTPGNAALISQTEIIFSFIFFQILRKEPLSRSQMIGTLCVIAWAVYLLFPKSTGLNRGDLYILSAMMLWPIGNYFQKQWRHIISGFSLLLIRFWVALPFILVISTISHESFPSTFSSTLLWQILGIAILINICKKLFWLESIKNITVSRVLALHGLIPFFTLLFAWVFLGTSPTSTQLIAGVPMIIGVLLLTRK